MQPPRSADDEFVPDPERFWAGLLSGDPRQVRSVLLGLPPGERSQVVDHLRRMTGDPGWQAAQRRRARRALEAIGETAPSEEE